MNLRVLFLLMLPLIPTLLLVASLANDLSGTESASIAGLLGVVAALVGLLAVMLRFNLLPG